MVGVARSKRQKKDNLMSKINVLADVNARDAVASGSSVAPVTEPKGAKSPNGQLGFDPKNFRMVSAKRYEDLKVGDVFRAPSRTLTEAHTSEFQAVSGDNHPRHYNDVYAKSHGMKAALVQPLQILALSAPGASLFTHRVGEVLVGFTETSCRFLIDSFVGDTLYAALEIVELSTAKDKGFVTTAITIHNQRNALVLSGNQKFTLKLSPDAR
jgi:acyl dehydratase